VLHGAFQNRSEQEWARAEIETTRNGTVPRAFGLFSPSVVRTKQPMTSKNSDQLEPIEPSKARELYLKHKRTECRVATVKGHKYRTSHFVRWCEENGIENMNNLTGRDLHEYRLWRKEDGDLNQVSLSTQMGTIRVFLRWCSSIEAVPSDLADKVLVPSVSGEAEQRDKMIKSERAEEILARLTKFQYASREHVVFALLWETGMRMGAARGLDLEDIDPENNKISLVHQPEDDTPLKNGKAGERLVAISAELEQLLDDYISAIRTEVPDSQDRKPLLTSRNGRLGRATIRRIIYRVTAPCFLDKECPDCAQEADYHKGKCGESVGPHAIRRSAITHFLTNDVPVEVVGERMNVSRDVVDKHYDERSEEVKVEQRRGYLDNI